nr:hypothetical protein [uncultured bacterium]
MFEDAIESAAAYTRPIHTISRNYRSPLVQRTAATIFFVNPDGWALTCRHVAESLIGTGKVTERRQAFLNALAQPDVTRRGEAGRQEVEASFSFTPATVYELHHKLMDAIEGELSLDYRLHPTLDIALFHFKGSRRLLVNRFPVFAPDQVPLRPGKYICRLGFPFAEFENFEYDTDADAIRWTNTGRNTTPRFPIDGMVTRLVVDKAGQVFAFETSTPGLRGQSGGPAFDANGVVWGMQAATSHLDLDFDVSLDVIRDGAKKRISESAILHVGHCIHADALKAFMREHGVEFQIAPA